MRFLLVLFRLSVIPTLTFACFLHAQSARRQSDDGGFEVQVSGSPDKYVPGSSYTIRLTSADKRAFHRFKLFLESSQPGGTGRSASLKLLHPGSFQLLPSDDTTAFDADCSNTVSEADDRDKTEIQVLWLAPPAGNGCVRLVANLLAHNKLLTGGGRLVRELCEYTEAREVKYTDCCACDEARYKLIFQGLWRNETHPKDFPKSLWLTHFSDVVGGTHGRNFSFWGEGQLASPGLKQLAEWGATGVIDTELRSKSRHFRSLIRASGLWYPEVNGNTSATFRVDKRRNLLSLVSMLGPSPDWLVGVSGLNLCLPTCSWVEQQVIDLYPYDAGTDNGVSYMSINIPAVPQEKIHKISPMYPEDDRAPFYDPVNNFMHPLARLYITRDKVIRKSCDDKSVSEMLDEISTVDNEEEAARPECDVTQFSPWSGCSVACGKGLRMRTRAYVNPLLAARADCSRQLVAKEMCVATAPACPGEEEEDVTEGQECKAGEWEAWSECSVSCGQGIRTRVRRLPARTCPHMESVQREACVEPPCAAGVDPLCPVTGWSQWAPCNASCGYGFRVRSRVLQTDKPHEYECLKRTVLSETKRCKSPQGDCALGMAEVRGTCLLPEETGPCHQFLERFRFEPAQRMCIPFSYGGCEGNENNFYSQEECQDLCRPLMSARQGESTPSARVDCVVGDWSPWSNCSVECGRGFRARTREVLVQPSDWGRPCPRLSKRRGCVGERCS